MLRSFIVTRRILLTKAVLPARMIMLRTTIIGYAFWKGIMDWSTSDVPAFVYADATWKTVNLTHFDEHAQITA